MVFPLIAVGVLVLAALACVMVARLVTFPRRSQPDVGQASAAAAIAPLSIEERRSLWQSRGLRKKMQDGPALEFENFVSYLDSSEEEDSLIATDLRRSTLTDPNTQVPMLREVLSAVTARNPAVGYVQGMNLLAGMFIALGLNSEETYYGVVYLLDEIAPRYFEEGMHGVKRDIAILENVVKQCGSTEEPGAVAFIAASLIPSLGTAILTTAQTLRLWDAILFHERTGWLAASVGLLGVDCATKAPAELTLNTIRRKVEHVDVEHALTLAVSALSNCHD